MSLKRWTYVLFGLIIGAALAGCARPYQITTPFNELEFLPYRGDGTATIQGQAFVKTRGGDVKFAAGNPVSLIPMTAYSREVLQAMSDGYRNIPVDQRWGSYFKQVTADGSGNFEFKNIPAGEYTLECSIFWEVPSRYGPERTGAVVRKGTKVIPNQTVKMILTE